jgi:hypothetical protein
MDLNEILNNLATQIQEYTGVTTYIERSQNLDAETAITVWFDDSNTWYGTEKAVTFTINVFYRFELSQYDDNFVESDAQTQAYKLWKKMVTSGFVGYRFVSQRVSCVYDTIEIKDYFSVAMKFQLNRSA